MRCGTVKVPDTRPLGLVDVRVLDHFIVTRDRATSMAESGLI